MSGYGQRQAALWNRPAKSPHRKVVTTVYLEPWHTEELARLAEDRECSVAHLIREAVTAYIEDAS